MVQLMDPTHDFPSMLRVMGPKGGELAVIAIHASSVM
jgi:hypothetical protein